MRPGYLADYSGVIALNQGRKILGNETGEHSAVVPLWDGLRMDPHIQATPYKLRSLHPIDSTVP